MSKRSEELERKCVFLSVAELLGILLMVRYQDDMMEISDVVRREIVRRKHTIDDYDWLMSHMVSDND